MGLLTPALGPAMSRRTFCVASSNCGTLRPTAAHASAASTAAPPALPMMASPRPPSAGWSASRAPQSSNSSSVSTRITPAWLNSASTTMSGLASAAVCDAAARDPAVLRPDFTDDDRRGARHDRRHSGKHARIPERLEVQQDDPRLAVLVPVPEQVVAAHVALVAHAHEAREADPGLHRVFEDGDPERTGLRPERDPAGDRKLRRRTWCSSGHRAMC